MDIVIDARMWNETGIGRYIKNLILGLQKVDTKNVYYLLLRRKEFNDLELNQNFNKVLFDVKWYTLKEQFELFKMLNRISPDLYHSPNINFCFFYRARTIVTVHDLIMLKKIDNEGLRRKFKRLLLNKLMSVFLRSNNLSILTVSNNVKKQIELFYNIESSRIKVVYNCVNNQIAQFNLSKSSGSYLLYVGNTYGHKNINFLVRFVKELNKKLIIVGKEDPSVVSLKKLVEKLDLKDLVFFEGYVDDHKLSELYQNAFAYVFPTLDEGFGLPGLEAMSNGCPVVCTDIPVLREIYQHGALYFEKNNLQDLQSKLDKLNETKFREDLIRSGIDVVKQYNCVDFVEGVLDGYKSVYSYN